MKNNSCGICFLEKYSHRKNIFLVVLASNSIYIYKKCLGGGFGCIKMS